MYSLSDKVRRFYREIVLRRSRVRIITADENLENNELPIFIIGLFRSGTTLLRYIVDSHSSICCPPESNFICELESLISKHQTRDGLFALGFDEEHIINRLRSFCLYFFNNYALSKNKPRWADKSTSSVHCLEFLYRIFPEAKYILIYRHGLDQVHSFTRGGTYLEPILNRYQLNLDEDIRLAGIRYWVEITEKMLAFEKKYQYQCISIKYEDLCNFPENTVRSLFNFIGVPWESQALRFYEFEHDKGPEHGRTIATDGFLISKDHYLKWDGVILKECLQISASTLEKLGYQGLV